MKYLFGPVNSRRLGLSQGIDLLPGNVCNFDCIYCEVGATRLFTCDRGEYSPTGEIIAEIDRLLADPAAPAPDIFTITATGEPTLHSSIGTIIRHLKAKTATPVAVLTNGSLLFRPEVRTELAAADIVIPSLDAARPRTHRRINRPAPCADLETIIDGLAGFRREFRGEIWLEILLVKDLNDNEEDIAALQEAAARIRPERIQLNTVARPPLESFAAPLSPREMEAIAALFPGRVEILVDGTGRERVTNHGMSHPGLANLPSGKRLQGAGDARHRSAMCTSVHEQADNTADSVPGDRLRERARRQAAADEILEMLRRRPCTLEDICEALNLESATTRELLARLKGEQLLITVIHNQREYFQVNQNAKRFAGGNSPAPDPERPGEQAAASGSEAPRSFHADR